MKQVIFFSRSNPDFIMVYADNTNIKRLIGVQNAHFGRPSFSAQSVNDPRQFLALYLNNTNKYG